MPTTFGSLSRGPAALLAAATIAACATPGDANGPADHHRHHRGGTMSHDATMAGVHAGSGTPGATMEGMDRERLCRMHRAIQDAPPDERESIREQQMKGMSPAMRQQLIDMMLRQCH